MPFPPPSDSLDSDIGGTRSTLAKYGIGYNAYVINSYAKNMLDVDRSTGGRQVYNGQQDTLSPMGFFALTYDLQQFGISDGQIVAGLGYTYSTWDLYGPRRIGLSLLSYYQTFLDRKVELKFGYLNGAEFIGQTGSNLGNTISGLGGTIPTQGGILATLSHGPAPGVIVKYNFTNEFYDKAMVMRSLSPDGLTADYLANPTGFGLGVPHAGVLVVDEIGFKRAGQAGLSNAWLRAGAAYNSGDYKSQIDPNVRLSNNSWYYGIADYQFWQTDPVGNARKGVYGGLSAFYAPPELNSRTQTYEARIYGVGLIDHRPDDMIALVYGKTVFSGQAVETAALTGALTHRDQNSVTLSYNAHLARGIYSTVGLGYVDNPSSITYTPTTGSALIVSASLSLFW